eukprot:2408747-Alexandrium_andersonii.AAC.1
MCIRDSGAEGRLAHWACKDRGLLGVSLGTIGQFGPQGQATVKATWQQVVLSLPPMGTSVKKLARAAPVPP